MHTMTQTGTSSMIPIFVVRMRGRHTQPSSPRRSQFSTPPLHRYRCHLISLHQNQLVPIFDVDSDQVIRSFCKIFAFPILDHSDQAIYTTSSPPLYTYTYTDILSYIPIFSFSSSVVLVLQYYPVMYPSRHSFMHPRSLQYLPFARY